MAADRAMVQRVPVASVSSAARRGGEVARRLRLRAQLDHRRGEADQMHRVQQMRVQHRLLPFGHQGDDIAEGASRGAVALHRGRLPSNQVRRAVRRPPAHRRRPHDTATAAGGDGAVVPCVGAVAPRSAGEPGRRASAVGDVAEADQHHLGRGAAVGGGFHLADALQQHLPGAGQHRHASAGRPVRRRGCVRLPADPWLSRRPGTDFSRVTCAAAPAGPAAACRDRRRAHRRGR